MNDLLPRCFDWVDDGNLGLLPPRVPGQSGSACIDYRFIGFHLLSLCGIRPSIGTENSIPEEMEPYESVIDA